MNNDRILKAISTLKEKQDELGFDLKQLAKEFEKSSSLNMQEAILRVADDLARYTIQDGYWYYNGKSTGIKAEGVDGEQGPQGIQGIPGKDGKDGKPGKDGKNGKDGKDGKPGLNGKDGKDGKDGKNGTDGKDGVTPLIKIGKVESSDTYGGADVKMRFGKGNIIYLDFTLPMGRPGFPGLDGKDGAPGKDGEKGEDAKINGMNTLNLVGGSNINLEQEGDTITINASGGGYIEVDDEIDPESENPVQNKVIYEDQQRQDNLIEMSFNTLPKITGSNDTINNTSNTPMELELLPSELEQVTTTGKNLLEPNIVGNWVSGYIPVEANKPYIYSESGVGTACFVYFYETLEDEGTYTYMGANEAYTPTQDGYIRINKGTSTQINLMLEQSSTVTTYEPYTNGASPNPDYPQEIHTVTGDNTVKVVNKNLLNIFDEDAFKYGNGQTKTNVEQNGLIVTTSNFANGRNKGILIENLKQNTDYVLSFVIDSIVTESQSKMCEYEGIAYNSNDTYNDIIFQQSTNVIGSVIQKTFNSGTYDKIAIHISGFYTVGAEGTLTYHNLIVEKGTTATDYTPHKEQTYPITLGDIEYCKIGDYSDEFVKQEDKWYLKKNVRHLSLAIADMDNSEDYPGWTGLTQLKEDYPNSGGRLDQLTDYKCNIATQSQSGISLNTTSSLAILYLRTNIFNLTQTQWKTNYPNLTVELDYGLNTPEYILLNDTLQTELNNIQKAVSYNEQTNIIQVNDDLPFIINYSANKNVPTKLSELTNDSGYVKDIDYAGENKGGTVKIDSYYGVDNADQGKIRTYNYTYEQYSSKDNRTFIGKGTLENVITGKGLTNVAHTNENNNFSTNQTITGNLTVVGDISQTGTSYETHAEQLFTKNDLIKTRDGAVGGLGNDEVTGIEAIKYDGTNNGRLVFDNTGTARVGDVGDEVPLLARDESTNMVDSKVLTWDSTNLVAKTTIGFVTLTQAQYDALVSGGTVDANTYYFIEEE